MPSSHWRNILHHHDEPDEAMQRISCAGCTVRHSVAVSLPIEGHLFRV